MELEHAFLVLRRHNPPQSTLTHLEGQGLHVGCRHLSPSLDVSDLDLLSACLFVHRSLGHAEQELALVSSHVLRTDHHVNAAFLEQDWQVLPEQGKQQAVDVPTVNVRVSQQNDLAEPNSVERVLSTQLKTETSKDACDLFVVVHLVLGRLHDVQGLATHRKRGLKVSVPSQLCRTACRVAFDQVELACRSRGVTADVCELRCQAFVGCLDVLDQLLVLEEVRCLLPQFRRTLHQLLGHSFVGLPELCPRRQKLFVGNWIDTFIDQLVFWLVVELWCADLVVHKT